MITSLSYRSLNLPTPIPEKTPSRVITSMVLSMNHFLTPVGSLVAVRSSVVFGPPSPGPIFANRYSENRSPFSITGKLDLPSRSYDLVPFSTSALFMFSCVYFLFRLREEWVLLRSRLFTLAFLLFSSLSFFLICFFI